MSDRSVVVAGLLTVIAGFGLIAVHYYGGSAGDPEGWFAAAGFAAPFVGAGTLCLVGDLKAQPMLRVAAGIALAIMSLVSIIMFPLLLTAGVMIAAARRIPTDQASSAVPFLLAASLVIAFGFLVFHQDPATWSTPQGGGSTSDIVTGVEASTSLAVTATVVLGSILWSQRMRP